MPGRRQVPSFYFSSSPQLLLHNAVRRMQRLQPDLLSEVVLTVVWSGCDHSSRFNYLGGRPKSLTAIFDRLRASLLQVRFARCKLGVLVFSRCCHLLVDLWFHFSEAVLQSELDLPHWYGN